MRIEVLVGSSDPIIYPMTKNRIMIGSAESNDVIISDIGVSRKHLLITVENDIFYISDQGSTNGSFMNEVRLVPGRRTEFTSFFPVRLGDDVLITLLSDDETSDFSEGNRIINTRKESTQPSIQRPVSDATRTIKLSDLKGDQTQNLIKKRQVKRVEAKKAPKKTPVKKKESVGVIPVISFLILAGAAIYQWQYSEPHVEPVVITEVGKIVPVEPKIQAPIKKLVAESDLPKKETLLNLTRDMKCITDLEKYLCGIISGADSNPWGVAQVGTMLNVLIDGKTYFDSAESIFKRQNGQTTVSPLDEETISKLATVIFLEEGISSSFDYEQLKDNVLTFALFLPSDELSLPRAVITIYPSELKRFKEFAKDNYVKANGVASVNVIPDFYRTY